MSGYFSREGQDPPLLLRFAGVGGAAVAASGGKLAFREWDPAEHLTGILPTAGRFAALLGGNTVIQHRHQQLGALGNVRREYAVAVAHGFQEAQR